MCKKLTIKAPIIIILGIFLAFPLYTVKSTSAQCTPDLPAIDLTCNWEFTPIKSKGKVVGGTLTIYNTLVTTSVISASEFYLWDELGIEEILDASIIIPALNRDSVNPLLFANSTLDIEEGTNTYLSSNLINIEFTPVFGGGGVINNLILNECYDEDNLTGVDTSANANASRFIDELVTAGPGPNYPNLRLTLTVTDGSGDFSDSAASWGSCTGKIESASAPPPTTTTTTVTTTTTTITPTTTTTVEPTVISLSSFEAIPGNRQVTLTWTTGSEIDNEGFNLYRSDAEGNGYIPLNDSLIPARGSDIQGFTYEYIDRDVKNRKTYYYMLEDIDVFGKSTLHDPRIATPRWIYGILK